MDCGPFLLPWQRFSHTWERAVYGLPDMKGAMMSTLSQIRKHGDVALFEALEKRSPRARARKMFQLLLSLGPQMYEVEARRIEYFTYHRVLLTEASFNNAYRLKKAIEYHEQALRYVQKGEFLQLRKSIAIEVIHTWANAEDQDTITRAILWIRDEYFLCDRKRREECLVEHLLQAMNRHSARIRFEILTASMCALISDKWASQELFEPLMLKLMQMRDRRMLQVLAWPHGDAFAVALQDELALMKLFPESV